MENDVAKTLYKHGTVWVVQTKSFTGTVKLTPADLDKEPDDIGETFHLGQAYIFPDHIRDKATSALSKVATLMGVVGEPLRADPENDKNKNDEKAHCFLKGATFVPFENTLAAKEGLEKIKADHKAIGYEMAERLPEFKKEMIGKYPILKDAKWPTPEQIINKFDVSWLVFQSAEVNISESDPT